MNPFFLKAFSVFSAGQAFSITDFIAGLLNYRHEILALVPVLKITGKSTATAFNLVDADVDKLVAAFVTKVRASYMGVGDAVNMIPSALRDMAQIGLGGDMAQIFNGSATFGGTRVGNPVNATGGTALVYQIPLAIPFVNVQREGPNMNALSAGQLVASSRVDVDTVAGVVLTQNVVLGGGTFAASALTMELWALTGSIRKRLWCAPIPKFFSRLANATGIEQEAGPLYDETVFSDVDAQTAPFNTNQQVTITIDGKLYLFQTPVQNLPGGGSAVTRNNESSLPSYDVWQNTKSSAARVGRVPLIFPAGVINPVEGELPVVSGGRTINFGAITAAPLLHFWRQLPVATQEYQAWLQVMAQDPRLQPYFNERQLEPDEINTIKSMNFKDFAIYGQGSGGEGSMNSDLSLFKPREFAPMAGAAASK